MKKEKNLGFPTAEIGFPLVTSVVLPQIAEISIKTSPYVKGWHPLGAFSIKHLHRSKNGMGLHTLMPLNKSVFIYGSKQLMYYATPDISVFCSLPN